MPVWLWLPIGWFVGAVLLLIWFHGMVRAERRRERRRMAEWRERSPYR